MDLKIKRKYDSQEGKNVFYTTDSSVQPSYLRRYLYSFTDTNSNNTYYIGVETEDDLYEYLYYGCYLTSINENKIKTYTDQNNETYQYYLFEDIYQYKTEDVNAPIHLIYNEGVLRKWISVKVPDVTRFTMNINKILTPSIKLGNGWNINLPEVSTYRYDYSMTKYSNYKLYERKYNGAFRDIEGRINTFNGTIKISDYNDGHSIYYATYTTYDNRFYTYTSYYTMQTIANSDIEYNFKIKDNKGYTYYFYCGNLLAKNIDMRIVAIENDYSDNIVYNYIDGKLTSITDTYGRVINFLYEGGKTIVSYNNGLDEENKTIEYNVSVPDEELINDSPLKAKPASMFSVTNEEGEVTRYYSRPYTQIVFPCNATEEALCNYDASGYETREEIKGNILEKIIYPNGLESEFKYERAYAKNGVTRTTFGLYILIDSYDKESGQIKNHKTYNVVSQGSNYYNKVYTTINGRSLCKNYKKDGMLIDEEVLPAYGAYTKYKYTYGGSNYLTKVQETSILTKETSYSYHSMYGELIWTKKTNTNRETYLYHSTSDNVLTDKIKEVKYEDLWGNFQETYTLRTTLTADEREIETETIYKDEVPRAKKKYTYDSDGNIIKTDIWLSDTDGDGDLDENDEVISVSSSTTIENNGFVSITEFVEGVMDADGVNPQTLTDTYRFNIFGKPVSHIDSYNNITSIEYDSVGRVTGYNYPNNSSRQISYFTAENCTILTDVTGAGIRNTYNGYGNIIKKERFEDDDWVCLEERTYDDFGRLKSYISYIDSVQGTKQEYEYNRDNRINKKKTYKLPNNNLLYTENYSYEYESKKLVVTISTQTSDSSVKATVKEAYNIKGNMVYHSEISGGKTIQHSYSRDNADRLRSETLPNGGQITYTHDCFGNVLSVTDEMNNTKTMMYDMAGRLISETDNKGNVTSHIYDKAGRKIKDILPSISLGTPHIKYYYDSNSRLVKQATEKEEGSFDIVENIYDVMGNVVANIKRGGSSDIVTAYSYDAANRLIAVRTGLTAYSENSLDGALTSYTYDQWGNTLTITDPNGKSTIYGNYNYVGNPGNVTDRNGNTIQYTYGVFGQTQMQSGDGIVTTSYDNLGNKLSENDGNTTEIYGYDPFGRVNQYIVGGITQSYTYDNNSNIISYTLNNENNTENTTTYQYNAKNQLTQMTANGTITTYTYDANGNLTAKTADNGLTTSFSYNNANLITGLTGSRENEVYNNYQYEYYLNGNKKSETSGDSGMGKLYGYDNFGQLISEVCTSADGEAIKNTQYTYDSFGNRTAMNSVSGEDNVTESYSYDINNRLMTITETLNNTISETIGFTYDDNGNQISKSVVGTDNIETFTYNKLNRLTEYNNGITSVHYAYNPSGLRKTKTQGEVTTNYYWNGSNLTYESKTNGEKNYYYYDVTGISSANFNGTVNNFLKDSHANVVSLLDSDGNVIRNYAYDAFGNQQTENDADINPFRYCGEYMDLSSGLIYLRNRYYDPATSRMLSEDPARQGTNWYIYCNNNPLKYIDPSGLYYLEKDSNGQVYAVIESGDTLSGISYSEVRDSTAYTKLNYADPGYLEVGQRVNITGIYNKSYPVPTNIMLSKTSHTQGDSGLRDVPDDEISRRARDKSLPGEERRRYQKEEKLRGQRNKQKRQSHYNIHQSKLPYPNTEFLPAPSQSYPTVNMTDSQFLSNVGTGVITVVGVAAGIYYFCYTGDPSIIYQYAY